MRRQKKKFKNTLIALIVLVAAVCILWFVVPGEAAEPVASGGEAGEVSEVSETSEVSEGSEDTGQTEEEVITDQETGPKRPWFYDEARSGRYEAFASKSPWLSFDDVVWRVNVNLDLGPYEDPSEVIDPYSLTALVNKFFKLPSDFSPPDLVQIGNSMLREEAASAMNEMIEDARAEGHQLWVQSGYRSYDVQANLYSQYSARDGEEGADMYSAKPGHSEHQLGLAADFNTITDAFGDRPEGIWAKENSWKYGFIIRYTFENMDITFYKPEPWHVRYIGRDAAAAMQESGILSFEEFWVKYVAFVN